ncbi:D-lactate dehydrogenase (cytochrome) [Marchantia polymorpha subsp. ruderalis]|uniref:D-lactate dehydrogenase (cytochrome) n=2 Tax=Marchantia polymorpha TaxID=3197 RepID=A0A176WBB8_MARPO|nr:hypothetical protein AXG93_4295s1800 [Marchantia polymorpha subsp. ruderalis]PTQ37584.1 hypothetical protein MARPO_0056s0055 [Marchantia polymorpha]PTQ37585.1 hypothetical protein MARPO_0056s0055 [Marchantia polymorpha]BBN14900.1 hypothetical protein Mp_6g15430 [Marchantia polymorpha subsp. ruderalis]BBN14901.1 hypothetical protein Mp_6g15430 [Marchantia polymorpha subsp. ruderalis]|eukprot:PTQ37584.1 hypothetical protein MARPO_0056s0055 [Marchantia polymorpha]
MASYGRRSSCAASRLFIFSSSCSSSLRSVRPCSHSSSDPLRHSSRFRSRGPTLASTGIGSSASPNSLARISSWRAASSVAEQTVSSSSWRKYVVGGVCASAGFLLWKQYPGQNPVSSQSIASSSGELVLPPKVAHAGLPQAFIQQLHGVCEEERIVFDFDERDNHGKNMNSYHRADNIPDVVVYPETTEEVVSIVKLCQEYKVPITAYGAATSLEGHTLALHGGVSIDMTRMKKIKELHIEDMDVVVEPGMGWIELNQYLKPKGLFFPLDPGPGATVGGMCATRCSGSLAVRYGTMRDNVISLKVVMANGDVVKTASRARKSAAGYDLTRLMIGSEGTLGIITEVTLRLQKLPEASTVAMCNFPSVKDAADVAIGIMHSGIQASRVELLDEVMMKAANLANGKNYKEAPTLMFELIGTEAYVLEQTERVKKIAEEHSASNFTYAESQEAKDELWKIRKELFWACQSLQSDAEILTTDVCVPLSRLADCIAEAKAELDKSSLITGVISHAGDGNFHTLIMVKQGSEEDLLEAKRLSDLMVHTALNLGGTCTGEHGVGIGKVKYLEKELGPEAMKVMGSIKETLDPDNIFNPGKVVPSKYCY